MVQFTLLTILLGCGEELKISDADANRLRNEGKQILNEHSSQALNISVDKYPTISSLQRESVDVRHDGLYIIRKQSWVKESGIFIPRDEVSVNTDPGMDPRYERISEDVFIYWIKG